MAGVPMKERVIMFTSKFPDKIISQVALFNLYKKNGARRKQIHIEKVQSQKQKDNFEKERTRIIKQL